MSAGRRIVLIGVLFLAGVIVSSLVGDPFGSSESPVSPTRKLKGSLDAYAAKGDAKPKGRSGQSSFGNIKLGGKKQQPMPEGAPHAKPLGPGKSRCGRGNATM